MAWNPSPQVQVARDAAQQLGVLAKSGVEQVVIIYVADDGRMGSVSYGRTKALCDQAKLLSDELYQRAFKHLEDAAF